MSKLSQAWIALAVLTLLGATAPAAAADALSAQALATVKTVLEAQRQFDLPTLERVLADDYLEISPRGLVDPRARALSFYGPQARQAFRAQGVSSGPIRYAEEVVRVDGERATVIVLDTTPIHDRHGSRQISLRVQMTLRRAADRRWLVETAHFTAYRPAG
jgi:ketosteroid isomerase-like protein